MKSIDILKEEHIYIKMVLKAIRQQCLGIVEGRSVEPELFYQIIDFVRNYADKYHHKKEEDYLFDIMGTEMGEEIKNGAIMGMFVEHDYGRAYIYNLEIALRAYQAGNQDARVDIIANAIGYEQMLIRHIDKEDNAVYMFAEKNLSSKTLEHLDVEFEKIENDNDNVKIRDKYISFAKGLEQRLNTARPDESGQGSPIPPTH